MYWDHDMSGWEQTLMIGATSALWALVVLVAMAALSLLRGSAQRPQGAGAGVGTDAGVGSAAERLLAERFARGEIDDDEYYRRLAALHEGTPLGKDR